MEKTEETNEEENKEKATTEDTNGNSDEGSEHKTPQSIIDANNAAERIEKATAEAKMENDRREEAEVRRSLGGSSEAGSGPTKPKEDTRTPDEKANDYVDKLERGETNPLKEDGYI